MALSDIGFGSRDRVGQRQALGDVGGECCRQGAAGAVGILRLRAWRLEPVFAIVGDQNVGAVSAL